MGDMQTLLLLEEKQGQVSQIWICTQTVNPSIL